MSKPSDASSPSQGLKTLQAKVGAERIKRGTSEEPLHVLATLTEEVGEVANALRPLWAKNPSQVSHPQLADELVDVLICVLAMANRFEIDLDASVNDKFFRRDAHRARRS